jgi:GNAT superfamily N-acetyltransferase
MAVLPGYRGRGIGSALIRWIEERAVRLGAAKIKLSARSQQPDNRPFYLRLGYAITGYSPRYGISDIETHMEKPLP